MRGTLFRCAWVGATWLIGGASALAGQAVPTPRDPAPAPHAAASRPAPCVTVTIADVRAGALDCAAERLGDAARRAQRRAAAPGDAATVSATSGDLRTGVASRAATRQRMGNAFGTGLYPQRPAAPVFAPPLTHRP